MLILECSQGCYGRTEERKDGWQRYYIPSQHRWRGDKKRKWLKFENWPLKYISELSSIIWISVQVLIPDFVFPVYKIDREQSPGSEPDFFLSKITGPQWLKLPIARTDFDSPFEFKRAKFYCTCIIWFGTVYAFHKPLLNPIY